MKRVLLIVDDWEALEVYENRFARAGFDVHGASFGAYGIDQAVELRPDHIFIDLTFEDMHAQEACAELRQREDTRQIPITVVLNAGEAELTLPGRFPLVGDRVLRRPFDIASVTESLS